MFWNAGDKRIRFVDMIVPGNFEHYFAAIAPYLQPGRPPQFDKLAETAARYGLIVDPHAAETIIKNYGLRPLS